MNERTRELAEQAGFRYIKDEGIGWAGNHNASLPRFAELVRADEAELVRADEREACAKVCENATSANQVGKTVCINLAEKIRARGERCDLAKVGEVGVWGEKPPTKRDNLSWVGLTDEEVNELVTNNFNRRYSLVLAIEAKLKEKNSNDSA